MKSLSPILFVAVALAACDGELDLKGYAQFASVIEPGAFVRVDELRQRHLASIVQGNLAHHESQGVWRLNTAIVSTLDGNPLDARPGHEYRTTGPAPTISITLIECRSPEPTITEALPTWTPEEWTPAKRAEPGCFTHSGESSVRFEAVDLPGYVRVRYEGLLPHDVILSGTFLIPAEAE